MFSDSEKGESGMCAFHYGRRSARGFLFIIGLLAAASIAFPAQSAARLECRVIAKQNCDQSGCRAAPSSVFNKVDIDTRTLSRCDNNGCDHYTALLSVSGAYINFSVPKNGLMARLDTASSQWTEIATIGGTVLVSFEICFRDHDQ